MLFGALAGKVEGIADDALGAPAREHRPLDDDFAIAPLIDAATDIRIFPLGVLTHDEHVDVARLLALEGRLDAFVKDGWSYVDVLIEGTANRQQQPLQGHMIGEAWIANRAQIDGIERGQCFERVLWHHAAMPEVVLRSPIEAHERERQIGDLHAQRLHDPDAFVHHLFAHPVAGDHRNGVLTHTCPFFWPLLTTSSDRPVRRW